MPMTRRSKTFQIGEEVQDYVQHSLNMLDQIGFVPSAFGHAEAELRTIRALLASLNDDLIDTLNKAP